MAAGTALSAVSEAVFGVLQDAALQTATPGGWHDDVPQVPSYPFGWYELRGSTDRRGLGTGNLPELELRCHVFSQYGGRREAQGIVDQVAALLKDVALTVTGWTLCGQVFYDQTLVFPDEEVNGVKVIEMVAMFRIYVE